MPEQKTKFAPLDGTGRQILLEAIVRYLISQLEGKSLEVEFSELEAMEKMNPVMALVEVEVEQDENGDIQFDRFTAIPKYKRSGKIRVSAVPIPEDILEKQGFEKPQLAIN